MQRGGLGAARRGAADLRCEVAYFHEPDDLRMLLFLGEVQRRLAKLRRGGWRAEVEATTRGGRGRGLGGAGPLPQPHPAPHPDPPRLPPRPSAPSLTLSLRLASAPALSSDSTQGAWPL